MLRAVFKGYGQFKFLLDQKIWKIRNATLYKTKRLTTGAHLKIIQRTRITGSGSVVIGKDCVFGYKPGGFYYGAGIELQARYAQAKIEIGNHVKTNNNLFVCAADHVLIGDNVLIGQGVVILDFEAHGTDPAKRNEIGDIMPVKIGNNVWLGNNTTILKGVTIGDNSIVASHTVVTKPFPSNVIIGGVPAKIIRSI